MTLEIKHLKTLSITIRQTELSREFMGTQEEEPQMLSILMILKTLLSLLRSMAKIMVCRCPQRLEVEMISLQFSFLHMKQKFIYILSIESLVLLVISDPLVLLCLKIYGLILCRM